MTKTKDPLFGTPELPRTQYHRDIPPGLSFEGQDSLTKQAFADECDINNILKRFEKTGVLPDMIKSDPVYGDFSDAGSYQEALNIVMHAEEQFAALSANVRERFGNDPQRFLEFATDDKNSDEMAKMGLFNEDAVARIEAAKAKAAEQPLKSTEKPKDGA